MVQVGDFDPLSYKHARVVVPSTGGAGPATVAALLINTFHLASEVTGFTPEHLMILRNNNDK